ncbi:hypothetical protein G6F60_015649 [Rhizopus arrhizus]|nr:hypothetical protein G6F60_015649 [Rhizopus arrhizus]
MAARFAGALRQARFGRRGRLMRGQREVVPLQGHVGIAGHPTVSVKRPSGLPICHGGPATCVSLTGAEV